MDVDDDISKTLEKIAAQWDKTEKILKQAESVAQAAIIPSVFELRYAGRRLVDLVRAALAKDAAKTATYLLEVEQFCLRAQHDAVDGIIGALNARLRFLEGQFGIDLLFTYFPHYAETNAKLDELAQMVVESRGNRGNRADIYDRVQADEIPELIKRIDELDHSEKALIALAEKAKKESDVRSQEFNIARKTLRWGIVAVIIAILFGLPSIISLFK